MNNMERTFKGPASDQLAELYESPSDTLSRLRAEGCYRATRTLITLICWIFAAPIIICMVVTVVALLMQTGEKFHMYGKELERLPVFVGLGFGMCVLFLIVVAHQAWSVVFDTADTLVVISRKLGHASNPKA